LIFIFLVFPFICAAQAVTYHNTIKPILQMHCMPCHTKGNIGAMQLTTYNEVSAYGRMIEYVTENRLMPPWKADGSYSHLKNYNNLTEAEIATIKTWINSNMPEGKSSDKYNVAVIDKSDDFGKPDTVLSMSKSFAVKADYTETAQVFVFPTHLNKDEYIDAIEFVPGNKKIVKSCTISIDTGHTGKLYDDNDLNYGYSSLIALGFIPFSYNFYQWTADEPSAYYYAPYVKRLPAGSNLLLHINYAASTNIQTDSSYIKIRFAKIRDTIPLTSSGIFIDSSHIVNGPFVVDVGDKRKFYAERKVKDAIHIQSVMPMGQFALSSWDIYAIDSLTQQRFNILKIPHWDAHWKKKYQLQTPVRLSAGSIIYAIAYYNNSGDNSSLVILPPKKIKYGEGQRDELFFVQFDVVRKQTNED